MNLKPGIYETDYGNTAIYRGGKTAYDTDAAERVPVELLSRYIRPLTSEEK